MQSTYFSYSALELFDLFGSTGPTGILFCCISTELYHAPHLTLYIQNVIKGKQALNRHFLLCTALEDMKHTNIARLLANPCHALSK